MNLMFLSQADITIGEGALYAVIGFIIVLLVLALLICIFTVSGKIFQSKLFNGDKAKKQTEQAAPTVQADSEEDEQVVAAITAAIACVLQSEGEGSAPEFVIRRIKRTK